MYIQVYNRSFCYLRMSGRRRQDLYCIFMLTKVPHTILRKLQYSQTVPCLRPDLLQIQLFKKDYKEGVVMVNLQITID